MPPLTQQHSCYRRTVLIFTAVKAEGHNRLCKNEVLQIEALKAKQMLPRSCPSCHTVLCIFIHKWSPLCSVGLNFHKEVTALVPLSKVGDSLLLPIRAVGGLYMRHLWTWKRSTTEWSIPFRSKLGDGGGWQPPLRIFHIDVLWGITNRSEIPAFYPALS